MPKNGRRFEVELQQSLARLANVWCYKIPDAHPLPGAACVFGVWRPFDLLCIIRGRPIGIECKEEAGTRIAQSRVQPHQRNALQAVTRAGGVGYVAVRYAAGPTAVLVPIHRWVEPPSDGRVSFTWEQLTHVGLVLPRVVGGWDCQDVVHVA